MLVKRMLFVSSKPYDFKARDDGRHVMGAKVVLLTPPDEVVDMGKGIVGALPLEFRVSLDFHNLYLKNLAYLKAYDFEVLLLPDQYGKVSMDLASVKQIAPTAKAS